MFFAELISEMIENSETHSEALQKKIVFVTKEGKTMKIKSFTHKTGKTIIRIEEKI